MLWVKLDTVEESGSRKLPSSSAALEVGSGKDDGGHCCALLFDLQVPVGFKAVQIQSSCQNHPGSPEEGQALMYNAFIGVIIGVGEKRKPACWQ